MNIFNARLQQKHDILDNWKKSTLVPLAGEIIVYDKDASTDVVRYKIGDGVTPVNDLPFADATELIKKVEEISERIEKGLSTLTPIDGTIILTDTTSGEKAIGVAIAPDTANALVAVDGGLFVPQATAGNGIEIIDNTINAKLADTTHGLVAVNGALSLNLATKNSDGAMSKEDKAIIEALPKVYTARKYEVVHKPEGTLVDYREKEVRIMCPANTEWALQNSGENADPNSYYIGFKAYAPAGAMSFREDTAENISDEQIYDFENNDFAGIDEYGRKYSIIWLPVAKCSDGAWKYYGVGSTDSKYVGWYYTVEWYSDKDTIIATDTIRINLSNEDCHNNINAFYGTENDVNAKVTAVDTKVADLQKTVADLQEDSSWSEF